MSELLEPGSFEEWFWRQAYRAKDEGSVVEIAGTAWMRSAVSDAMRIKAKFAARTTNERESKPKKAA